MIITTATQNSETKELTICSLFDTQTGLKYVLILDPDNKYCPGVKVEISSAHTVSTEDAYPGVTYHDVEAVDFWRHIAEEFAGVDVILANDALHAAAKIISDREFAKQLEDHKSGVKVFDSELPF